MKKIKYEYECIMFKKYNKMCHYHMPNFLKVYLLCERSESLYLRLLLNKVFHYENEIYNNIIFNN